MSFFICLISLSRMPSSSIHVVTDGKISFIYGCLLFCCLVAQRLKRLPAMRETRVRSLGWEDPLEKEVAPHCNILAWRIPWREEPGRHSPRGCKESDTTELLHFHSSVACACVFVCVLHLYPSWTCRSFPYFGCCNNAAVNTGVHIPFQIHVFLFFRQIPESFGLAKNVIQLFFYKMLWKTLNELFG